MTHFFEIRTAQLGDLSLEFETLAAATKAARYLVERCGVSTEVIVSRIAAGVSDEPCGPVKAVAAQAGACTIPSTAFVEAIRAGRPLFRTASRLAKDANLVCQANPDGSKKNRARVKWAAK